MKSNLFFILLFIFVGCDKTEIVSSKAAPSVTLEEKVVESEEEITFSLPPAVPEVGKVLHD